MLIAYLPYMAMHKRGGCSSPPPFTAYLFEAPCKGRRL